MWSVRVVWFGGSGIAAWKYGPAEKACLSAVKLVLFWGRDPDLEN